MKEDGTRYAAADVITLANNGVMHLFSNVKYELAGQEIECQQSGDCWCFNGYHKISLRPRVWNWNDQFWSPETSDGVFGGRAFARRKDHNIEKSDPHGSFSFAIELENLFGFCEDYDKVVYGMRHKLTLVRKSNDDAIFKIAATAEGKAELTKVAWVMPGVHPNDVKKFSL